MNNQEAKFILGGYRPGGSDAADPMFREALQQAERDPALGAWFARTQAHDKAVADQLARIAPPAGLREAILAGVRVSGARPAVWRQPAWLAMAAAAAVLIAGTTVLWPRRAAAQVDPVAKFAMVDALELDKHGGHGSAVEALLKELGDPSTRLSQALSVNFTALHNTGCRTVQVAGQPVLEVCFQRNGAWFHCYVARCEDFPALARTQEPKFAESGRVNAAEWTDGVHRFVVASVASREAIARLL